MFIRCLADKDSVRAGLLIFKPIQMPQSLPGGNSASQSIQQIFGQQSQSTGGFSGSFKSSQPGFGFQNSGFPGFQGAAAASVNGFQSSQANNRFLPQQVPNYLTQNSGYPGFAGFSQFPANSGGNGGESVSVERIPSQGFGLNEFNFNQQSNSQQEFNRQAAAGFPGQQLQLPSYSQENFDADQHDSASDSEEHIAQPTYKRANKVEKPKQTKKTTTEADDFPADFFLPTTAATYEDKSGEGTAKKRSAPKKDDQESRIVPLKYHDDSKPEDQARLKQTVQRFFSMLQKQRCKYQSQSSKANARGEQRVDELRDLC